MKRKTREELAKLGIFSIAQWEKMSGRVGVLGLAKPFIIPRYFGLDEDDLNDIFVGSGVWVEGSVRFDGIGQVLYPGLHLNCILTLGPGCILHEEVRVGDCSTLDAGCILYKKAKVKFGSTLGAGCILHEEAEAEERSTLGAGCILYKKAKVKFGSTLGAGCILHEEVRVGDCSTLGAGCILHEEVRVGDCSTLGAGCILYEEATVEKGATLGDGCILHKKARVEQDGTLANKVILGEESCCGEYAKLQNGVIVHRGVSIGKLAIIGAHTEIEDDCTIGIGARVAAGLILKSGAKVPDGVYVDHAVVRYYYTISCGRRYDCYWDADLAGYLKCRSWDRVADQDIIIEEVPLSEHPLANYVQRQSLLRRVFNFVRSVFW